METWSGEFDVLLREYLTELAPDSPIDPDAPMKDLGLNSVGIVGLIVDLEEELGVFLPEEAVSPSTFYSARTLWSALRAD
ncbi:acyl carrier protein [Streptomyces sp. DSM 44915]|uniref:Acyl carrier protein n=1 Tax=Streptomyces chisholmiae TaxID=3075540 RepID=A0ABU2JPZ0_9ACTN|nr:acyl carrier protein [Streptomyces sp. DSM 44915]MDT0266584.1 acyl carrier protein [Streptomyces sp. DSM 44915]